MQVDFTTQPDDPASSMTKIEYFALSMFSALTQAGHQAPVQSLARYSIERAKVLVAELNKEPRDAQSLA